MNSHVLNYWLLPSLSAGLPVVWTNARQRGHLVEDVWRWMSLNTGKLAGIDNRKCHIKIGYDADFVVWEPDEDIKVNTPIAAFRAWISAQECYFRETRISKISFAWILENLRFNNSRRFSRTKNVEIHALAALLRIFLNSSCNSLRRLKGSAFISRIR